MLINNEIVNRIINEVDIVDVVQEYVPLTLKSKNFWGVCPSICSKRLSAWQRIAKEMTPDDLLSHPRQGSSLFALII